MEPIRIAYILRYLLTPEDTNLPTPVNSSAPLEAAKTLLWFAMAIGAGLALAQLH
jgi:hypothetical protein